jgi:uncharacterized ion transporter superfamily protein YfcC
MVVSGVLTKVIEPGSYERIQTEGREMVVHGSFQYSQVPAYPVWRWFTAPFEVLAAPGNITVITIVLFLIFVAGAFTILEESGTLEALLRLLVRRFKGRKYLLMAVSGF